MTGTRRSLSVVCPVFNEEEVILDFCSELRRVLAGVADRFDSEIIFVVDRGTDRTLELLGAVAAQDPKVRILALSSRFGHQMSLLAGIDHAYGDAVVMLDSDLEHPPELIPEMLAKFEQGFDIVSTTRTASPKSFLKRSASRAFYWFINRISNVAVEENSPDFRLISQRIARLFRERIRERNQFLRGLFSWIGFKRTSLGYVDRMRAKGKTKYTISRMLRFAVSGVVSFSKRPLQWAILTGLGCAGLGFLLGLVTFVQFFLDRHLPSGWTTLVMIISLFSGIHLIFLGIIGEYLGAIFDEVKGRPHYIVEDAINFESSPAFGDGPALDLARPAATFPARKP